MLFGNITPNTTKKYLRIEHDLHLGIGIEEVEERKLLFKW